MREAGVEFIMSILITGAAGFIGSHSAKALAEAGFSVVTLDNLTTGRQENARWGPFIQGDIRDVGLVRQIIRGHSVQAVLHLAAFAQVGESMDHPETYFSNNVCGTHALLNAMVSEGVREFVFASSCSVYGNTSSTRTKVKEDEAVHPLSPYGESKLATERSLPWYERAHGMHWLALRYFNVAGAESNLAEPHAQPASYRVPFTPCLAMARLFSSSEPDIQLPTGPRFVIMCMWRTWRRLTSWRSVMWRRASLTPS
jgi:UDP-arabinose 4-epimerase